ncbi:MAG: hypothetical protein JOY83_06500 [Alphaproteobacteria bacterium]|nr:hypothetical protein [Alphaproteobacteria bacterium]
MKLGDLIFAGLICLIIGACEPVSTQAPVTEAPPQAPVPRTCDHNSTGHDFVSTKVFLLSPAFDPKSGAAPGPSEIVRNVAPTDPYWNDLTAAFDRAPDFFRDKLCSLDGIFVVQNACASTGCTVNDAIDHSWGFRQQISPPKRYIATSAALWENGSAPNFSTYKNLRLRAVLARLHGNGLSWFKLPRLQSPQFVSSSPDTAAMTMLAVLAHETGHVLWFDAFVNPPGGPFNADNFCGGKFYARAVWPKIAVPSGRWVGFGEQLANQPRKPNYAGTLQSHLSRANFLQARGGLRSMFHDREAAGALATFSPIEDFVEAYEWHVLLSAKPPLTDLTIQIPGFPPYDLVGGIANKAGLKRKMACF